MQTSDNYKLAQPNFPKGTKPLVSLVISVFNESSILLDHLEILYYYMKTIEAQYDWEFVIINDGSVDNSGELANQFGASHANVRVLHHPTNMGLGRSIRDGIADSRGDYVITLDIDLSCSPEHVEKLMEKIIDIGAKLVVASPTMKGGELSNVPWLRKKMSIWANRFLSFFIPGRIGNLTCMVRAYDGPFIRSLNLVSTGMEIMPEIIYKTAIMHGKMDQIPARLDWTLQNAPTIDRKSSMRLVRHTLATLLTGFILRPFFFFILPGGLLLLFSFYPIFWIFSHFFHELTNIPDAPFMHRAGGALSAAYELHPHTFFIGFFSLMLAIQLIAHGFQSLQNKHYFEELYNLATRMNRNDKR